MNKMWIKSWLCGWVALLFLGGVIAGCFPFLETSVKDYPMPTLESTGATLVQHPSSMQLAAYYCPMVLDSNVVFVACELGLGPAPLKSELTFFFELEFKAGNNGDIPLPVLEILVNLDLFEGETEQSLGSTCVELCAESDPECGGEPSPDACTDEYTDIDSGEDLAFRALELVFIGIMTGGDLEDFNAAANGMIRTIPPGDEILFTVRFGLGIDAMLEVLETLADEVLDDYLKDQPIAFEIPYRVSGAAWIDVPYVGRLAFDYGPFGDIWVIE